MEFGGRDVARTQLEYLADAADRDNVTLLVIPFSAGAFHGAGQSALSPDESQKLIRSIAHEL